MLPRILHFDPENSIIVFAYLDEYNDLAQYYREHDDYDTRIAAALGAATARLHKTTYGHQAYRDFIEDNRTRYDPMAAFVQSLERVTPEHFGRVPDQGLRFFILYQRYESLSIAVRELLASAQPSCLAHNDLKLNNILLHKQWQTETDIVRIIDWERCNWQDPAYDLGTVLAGYMFIWLNSLVVSDALSLNESLRMAATPLERLQPSMAALIDAYRGEFPEIFARRPDFQVRVVQFIGLVLIQNIQAMVEYQKSFGNMGICMLQVAKSLLCHPEQAMTTVFGAPVAIAA